MDLAPRARGLQPAAQRRFQLVLLKPSHYHDDGYVIRWWRALIPSNSLAAVYGLALDSAQRRVLDRLVLLSQIDSELRSVKPLQAIGSSHPNKTPGILVQAIHLV